MARMPASEKAARKVLALFVKRYECRADDIVFVDTSVIHRLRGDYFQNGIECASGKGWIEVTDKDHYKITELGYAQVKPSRDVRR